MEDEHWKAREDWVTYEDQTLRKDITAFGFAPKLSERPEKYGGEPQGWDRIPMKS